MQATRSPITSKFWVPPEAHQLVDVCEWTEKAMSGVYRIWHAAQDLSLDRSVMQLLSVLQSGKQELHAQCERTIAMLENASEQAQAYVHFAHLSHSRKPKEYAKHLQEAIAKSRGTATEIRNICTVQESGYRALREASEMFHASDHSTPPGKSSHGLLNGVTVIRSALSSKTASHTRHPFTSLLRRASKRGHHRGLTTILDETLTSFSRLTMALRALEQYYSRFPGHLQLFVDNQTSSPLSFSISRKRKVPQYNEEVARTEEAWTRYQQAISEATSRLMRAAKAPGTSPEVPIKSPQTRSGSFDDPLAPRFESADLYSQTAAKDSYSKSAKGRPRIWTSNHPGSDRLPMSPPEPITDRT